MSWPHPHPCFSAEYSTQEGTVVGPPGRLHGKQPLAPPPRHKDPVPTVTRSGNVLQLEVDAQSNQTLGPALVASVATAEAPLHLGGLPSECSLSLGWELPLRDQASGHPTLTPPSCDGAARETEAWREGGAVGRWPLL